MEADEKNNVDDGPSAKEVHQLARNKNVQNQTKSIKTEKNEF